MRRKRYPARPAPADSPGKNLGVPKAPGLTPAVQTGGRGGGSRRLASVLPVFSGERQGCLKIDGQAAGSGVGCDP